MVSEPFPTHRIGRSTHAPTRSTQ